MLGRRLLVCAVGIVFTAFVSGVWTSASGQTLTGRLGLPTNHVVVVLTNLTQVTDAGAGPPATPTNFLAVADNGMQDPPFPGGAVGTNHIVSTLDQEIRVQSRTGSNLFTVAVTNFWAAAGPYSDPRGTFDAKVVYDPYNDRWMTTAAADFNQSSSAVLVGVTQTGDPTGAWDLYRININTNLVAPQWANYPNIGFNKDWIAISITAWPIGGSSSNEEWQLYALSKTNLYAGGNGRFTRWGNSDFPTYNVVQEPCATYDNTQSNLYLVTDLTGEGGNGSLRLFYIDGLVGAEVLHVGATTASGNAWSQAAPTFDFAPQLGTSQKIGLDDSRLQNAVFRNGAIWTTHTIFLPAGGSATHSAVQWWQINPNGTILQQGRIEDPTAQIFYAYPSIAVNQLNDAVMGFAQFSASNYPSAYYAFRSHSDPTNTVQGPVVLKAGDAPFTRSDRWGDHTSTIVDPVNDLDFWTIQEYSTSTNVEPTSRWGTWWGRVTVAFVDLSISKTASPAPAIVGSNLTYTIAVTNLSAVPAANVTVTDVLPASVTFVSAAASQGSCTNVSGTLICSLSTMTGNSGASAQIVVVPTAVGTLTNTASLSTAATDSNLTNNIATNIVTVITAAHLTVTPGSRDFGVLTTGQTSTQSFSVINTGSATLTGSATASGAAFGVVSGGTFNLLANETGNVSVSFSPVTAGSFTGSVVFASNGGNATNQVTGGALTPGQLGVSPASFGFGAVVTGATAQTTFVVTNGGQSILTGTATVSGSTFAVLSGASYSVGAFGSSNVVVSFSPATAGNFNNQVIFASTGGASSNSVTGKGVTPAKLDVNPGSANFGTIATGVTAQANFFVGNSGGATLTGSATIGTGAFAIVGGSPFNFNVAGFTATNLTVTFTPPAAGGFATNLVVTSNGGASTNALIGTGAILPLADFSADVTNGLVPLAVTFTNKSSGTITNAFWDFGDGASTNTLVASIQHSYVAAGTNSVTLIVTGPIGVSTNLRPNYVVVRIASADLMLTNTAAPNPVPQGQSLTYTLTVTNRGTDAASSVTVTDALPAGVSFSSAASSQGVCTNVGGAVVCDLSALPAGSNAVVNIVVTPSVVGTITNRAVVFAGTADPNLSNNTGIVAVVVAPAADLALTQTAAPNPVLTSQNVTYTLTVTNLGPSVGSSVTVTDALPAGFNFVAANASQGTCTNVGGLVTCAVGTISIGSTVTVQITAKPGASSNITNISNAATVMGTEFDPVATNNTATVSIVVYLDADNDGIPDYWTQQFFGHGTGQASDHSRAGDDADGDGLSNLQEYLAGTSPVDPGSALRIITMEEAATNIVVGFASVTNKLYRLESSDDISGPWTNIVADQIAGTGETVQRLDMGAATLPKRFYRVHLLP